MNKKYFIMLLFLIGVVTLTLIFNVGSVKADSTITPTLTPRAGILPTVKSYESTPITDYTCKDGYPIGYMTKTPSDSWYYYCSSCLGAELPSETTVTPSITPTSTATSTGTITPTATPEGVGIVYWDKAVGSSINPIPYGNPFEYGNFNIIGQETTLLRDTYGVSSSFNQILRIDNYASNDVRAQYTNYFEIDLLSETVYRPQYIWFKSNCVDCYHVVHYYSPQWGSGSVIVPAGQQFNESDWVTTGLGEVNMKMVVLTSSNDVGATIDYRVYASTGNNGAGGGHMRVQIREVRGDNGGIIIPTEEPSGYCTEIKESSEEESQDQDWFGYSGVEYGALECLDIGPYSWTIFSIGLDIPYIAHMCFQTLNFGELALFGVSVSIDLLYIMIAVVWVIKALIH